MATAPDGAAAGEGSRFGRLLFRLRSFTPLPLLALVLPLLWRSRGAPHAPAWELSGLALCLAGQALRAWVLGTVRDGTSGQGSALLAVELNQTGPYAHVRNPLYVGNAGITLGLCLIAHDPLVLLLVGLAFAMQYAFIVAAEERFLRARFGAVYDAYLARVPRFWPRWSPAPPPGSAPRPRWDGARALRKEHNPVAAWVLLALLLTGWDRVAVAPTPEAGWGAAAPHLIAAALAVAAWLAVKGWKHGWARGGFAADLRRRLGGRRG